MTIKLTDAIRIAGTERAIGTVLTLPAGEEADYVHRRVAEYVYGNPSLSPHDPVTGIAYSKLSPMLRRVDNHIVGVPLFAYPRASADHQAAGGFSGGGAPTLSYTIIDGIPVVGVTSNGGQCQFDALQFAGRLLPAGRLSCLFYVANPAAFNSLVLLLGDNAYTNHFSATISVVQQGMPGWYFATIDPPATGAYSSLSALTDQRRWTVGGGTPDFASTSFINLRMRFNFPASPNSTVYMAGVWYGEKNVTPSIVVTADDGYVTQYEALAPLCERYGLRLSMGLIGNLIGQSGYMTSSQLQELVARGHECVIHGNPSPTGNLSDYATVAAIRADIAANREAIRRHGLFRGGNDERCYVYPQGVYQHAAGDTRIVDAIKAEGIIGARGTTAYSQNLAGRFSAFNNRFNLTTVGHLWDAADEAANVARVILRMQQAVSEGRSPILVFHKIVASPSNIIEITAANAAAILEAASELVRSGSARGESLSDLLQRIAVAGEVSY